MIKGSFGGIGSYIAYNTKLKRSMISEPFEGTPAAKAGLKAGDILMEIDGKDLAGKNNAEVSQMLRGQAGTSFKLKIERPNVKGGRTPMEFTIVRESIQNPAIPYTAVLDNNIGYIGLSTFSGNPSKEFKKAFLDLKKQGATSLVIDLRSNGGGLLDEAVEIANYFLPRGKVIVTTKGKIKQASNTYKTLREPLDLDIPIAVLVNSGTASASEILSGSLQDLDRAVIVGNRTFGKGLVQVPRSLPYGGTMKVTTSKYYIPSGRCVQAIDYKHRNEDGSVGTIPDSLTKVFYTAAGREVRDGGGVMPGNAIVMRNGSYTVAPGDAIYEDVNHDGVINQYDIVYLGNSNPRLTGGAGLNVSYKQFKLSAIFYGRYGQDVVNATRLNNESMRGIDNQSTAVLRRWRNEGDQTDIPRALYGEGYNTLGSDRFVEDASYLRLKSLSFTYRLPKKAIQRWGFNNIDVYVTGYCFGELCLVCICLYMSACFCLCSPIFG